MTLKLYGAPLSNYFNMVKTALIEKGVEYEYVMTPPSQESDYLSRSPMGKIPCIETDQGFLSETLAILDYIEDKYPQNPLLPADPFARGKTREIAQSLTLYVELVARLGYAALRRKEVPQEAKDSMQANLPKGAAAIARIAKFSPWIAGEEFSYADLVGYFTLVYSDRSAQANIGMSLFEAIPGSKEWFDKVGERASVKQALADQG